jgi:phosphonate transport system substrate-binding protein
VHVIWTTPTYPDYQWSVRGDIDAQYGAGFKQRLQQALLAMKDPELLQSFPRQSFVPASNSDYQPVEEVARRIGLLE